MRREQNPNRKALMHYLLVNGASQREECLR